MRVRGVSHPLPVPRARGRAARRQAAAADTADWTGSTRVYDIVKEAVIATAIVTALVLVLAGVLSSPDEPSLTIATWARLAPADFLGTATTELNGTSETATYGPPYNNDTGSVQGIGISWQELGGVRIPIDAPRTFVLGPLAREAPTDPPLSHALAEYNAAPTKTQLAWADAYLKALNHISFDHGTPVVPAGRRARARDARASRRALPGPQRGAGRQPDRQPALLWHELHQAAAVPRRRRVLCRASHRPALDG